jgi:metal-responsive CopG/Arc/MetJ family transcriptional regulator
MGYHKATYTLPEEVLHELNTFVEQRQRSRFVCEAIRIALEIKKQKLEEAYEAAASDKKRLAEIKEWSNTEVEGWNG